MLKKLIAIASLCLTPSLSFAGESDAAFTTLAEQVWQYNLKVSPLSAIYYGVDAEPGNMPDLSIDSLQQQYRQRQQYLLQLEKIEQDSLSEQNQINLTILKHRLQNNIDQFIYKAHQIPLTAEGGFHTQLGFIPRVVSLNSEQDVDNYLSRLTGFPEYFASQIGHLQAGLESGNSQPQVVLQGFETSIDGFIVADPEQSLFYQPVAKLAFLTEDKRNQLQQKAKQVIAQHVIPSFKHFRRFMLEQYIPNARTSIGVSDTPNGREFYQNRAEHFTTTKLTVTQIHEIGLAEVARIREEMMAIIEQVGFKGSFAEFLTFLRTDPQFYPTSAEQLLKEASFIAKKMDAQLPKFFKFLPRTPYGVEAVPDHIAPKYTTGRYVGPSKDTDPGYYWVNTYALDRRPLYELEALTLHEAVPGHHLQISLSQEMQDTPKYRSSYYISAFGEGWGLYSEWLGLEAGFYQDPYSNFGRLTYEMWRAARLVVDTGMHMMGWSRAKAMEFMKQNSALSEHNIKTEIDRYISWPGQALSYKIGELTIKKLRQRAEQALGNQFDIREFHYQVLKNGSVPLSLLEQQIDRYIAAEVKQLKQSK